MNRVLRAVQTAYRTVVPTGVRRELSCVREITRLWLTGGDRRELRGHRLRFWAGLGWRVLRRRLTSGAILWVDVAHDQAIGRTVYVEGEFEPAETAYLRGYLRPGMTVIDIGANIGYHTVLAARAVGPTGLVVAVEPDPYNFALLQRNLRVNRLTQVQTENCALGQREGTLPLIRSQNNYGDHRLYGEADGRDAVPVSVKRLDDVFAPYWGRIVDLLKIDVQGYEWHVFAGAGELLSTSPPRTILMEYWPYGIRAAGGDPIDLMDRLAGLGYRFHTLMPDGRPVPVERAALDGLVPALDPARPDHSYLNLILSR